MQARCCAAKVCGVAGTPHLVGCIRPNIQLQQGLYRIRVTTLRVVHEGRVLGLKTITDAPSNMSDTTLCVCVCSSPGFDTPGSLHAWPAHAACQPGERCQLLGTGPYCHAVCSCRAVRVRSKVRLVVDVATSVTHRIYRVYIRTKLHKASKRRQSPLTSSQDEWRDAILLQLHM